MADERPDCGATTWPGDYSTQMGIRPRGGKCRRKATYTNGTYFRCTQHAKEPATVTRKATGKIMAGWTRIEG